jgi:precorrin-3B C17-methyltransferase
MGESRLQLHTEPTKGNLAIVGLGPGDLDFLTPRALKVIADADYVIGNSSYLDPLEALLNGKTVIRSSMGKEVERAKQAIDLARAFSVAIVSGGDAGIYGMASIVLEVLEHSGENINVEVIPGITAANAAASRIGSPLSGDFAVISLSDLLTPLEIIEQRLDAVFSVGIPVVLYNPKSRGRPHNFSLALEHARRHLGPDTPLAIIRNALRKNEEVFITKLAEAEKFANEVDMHTTVIVGGKESRIWRMGKDVRGIITPRGYHHKYVY